jgi:hypothetical protein
MEAIWRGANHSGLFPLNNAKKCYHNGCSKYPGDEGWIYGAIHGGAGTGAYSFPYAFSQMQREMTATTGPAAPPTVRQIQPVMNWRGGRVALQGLGALADGTPEAVALIDRYFIPNNRSDSPAWAIPSSALEHQILYDVADAWLDQQATTTTPYIATPNTGGGTTSAPGAVTQADPTQGGTPSVTSPGNSGPVGGGGSNVGTTYDVVPVTNPATGATSYQLNPANPNAVARVANRPTTAGIAGIPTNWILLLMAGLALAVPLYSKEGKK